MRFINKLALLAGATRNYFCYPPFCSREYVAKVDGMGSFQVRKYSSDILSVKEIRRGLYKKPCFDLRRGENVVDLGANIGGFSIYAAKKVFPGRVWAVEPNKESFILLQKNKKINNLKNLEVLNTAISDLNGEQSFYTSSLMPVLDSLENSGEVKSNHMVKTLTLKTFFDKNNINRVDLLKIDIEGAEYKIIPTLTKYMLDITSRMIIEFHDYLNPQFNYHILKKFLEQHGFLVEVDIDCFFYSLSKVGTLWAKKPNLF